MKKRGTGDLKLVSAWGISGSRRQGADIQGLRRHIEEMREQPSDLAIEHADKLAAHRHLQVQESLDRQAKGMLLVHRRHIIEPIEVGKGLKIGLVFDQFFGAAVQKTYVGIDPLNHFAIEFENEPQYAVGCWMYRPEIDGEIAELNLSHNESEYVFGRRRNQHALRSWHMKRRRSRFRGSTPFPI